jgi:hypothetical protein
VPTLLETLQQNLGQGAAPVQMGQTQTVADILRAKQGKVGGQGGAPAASSLGAQAAANQTQLMGQQQATQGQLQGQQIQQQNLDEKASYAQQSAAIESKQQTITQQAQIKADQILQEASQQGRQLTFDQDADKLEQLGFNIRLQDKQYVSNLEIQGSKQRLNDANSFNQAMVKAQFGDDYNILSSKLDFNKVMSDNENDFLSQMQNIDINVALQMAGTAAEQANQQALYGGVGGLVSGGTQAYSVYANTPSTNTINEEDVNANNEGTGVEGTSNADIGAMNR